MSEMPEALDESLFDAPLADVLVGAIFCHLFTIYDVFSSPLELFGVVLHPVCTLA